MNAKERIFILVLCSLPNCNGFNLPEMSACLIRQQPRLALWKKKAPEDRKRVRGKGDHLASG